ncbi:thermonuclease family protein [Roseateles sp. BYS180W]|uniref:Thermonuclease family protein n=1 Tax=Roseateles rivi TaxID=3299028 RepID=A0ABW7FX01_9BURK
MDALLWCVVVGVLDGDTLRVRCGEQPQQVVRIAQIDAPEKRQPFGQRSREGLSELCMYARAELGPVKRDRYGRWVADVRCEGRDVASHQIDAGLAWAYTRYLKRVELLARQAQAQRAGRGLWEQTEPPPVAPWEWRRQR